MCRNCELADYINDELFLSTTDHSYDLDILVMVRYWHRKCKEHGCECDHAVRTNAND